MALREEELAVVDPDDSKKQLQPKEAAYLVKSAAATVDCWAGAKALPSCSS